MIFFLKYFPNLTHNAAVFDILCKYKLLLSIIFNSTLWQEILVFARSPFNEPSNMKCFIYFYFFSSTCYSSDGPSKRDGRKKSSQSARFGRLNNKLRRPTTDRAQSLRQLSHVKDKFLFNMKSVSSGSSQPNILNC